MKMRSGRGREWEGDNGIVSSYGSLDPSAEKKLKLP